ncbi:MAG: VCBS repeat-containing protein [Nannocystaceae bacterium]
MVGLAAGCGDDTSHGDGGSSTSESNTLLTDATLESDSLDASSSGGSGSDSSGSTGGGSSDGGSSSTTAADSTGGSSSSSSSDASSDGSGSTTGSGAACGDGVIDVGEFCPEAIVLDGEAGGRGIVAADVDGDDDIDLVTVSQVFVNDGSGTFAVTDPFLAQPEGSHLAVGAVDAEPDLDVVVPIGEFAELRNNQGGGSFAAPVQLACSATCYAAAIGDLDGDALGDIAIGQLDGQVQLWQALGDGSFAGTPESPPGAGEIRDAAIVDLDGDAPPELVVSDYYGGLAVRAAGQWTAFDVFAPYLQVATGDLDGDADVDLVGAMSTAGGLQVQLGDGDAGFDAGTLIDLGRGISRAVAVADLDADGVLDVAAVSYGGDPTLWLARGMGDGDFAPVEAFDAPCGGFEVVAAELDGDGATDLAIYCGGDGAPAGVGVVLSDP